VEHLGGCREHELMQATRADTVEENNLNHNTLDAAPSAMSR
jgi:hypothetical protein